MPKSPKTTKPKEDSGMKIKSILKEPNSTKKEPVRTSKKAESPPQLIPNPTTTKKDGKASTATADKAEEDDEYYYDIFFDIVSKDFR